MRFLQRLMGRGQRGRDGGTPAAPTAASGPSEARSRFERGAALLQQGDARAAAELLLQAIALRDPQDDFVPEAHLLRGRAWALLGDTRQALVSHEAAIAARAGYAEAATEAAGLLHALGRHEEAVTWADRRDIPTGDVVAASESLARGNAALQTWDLAAAAACYRRAAAAAPSDPVARLNRGFVALEQGDANSAIGHLRQALALSPSGAAHVADAQFLLGRAYRTLGHAAPALAAFDTAAVARPDFVEPIEEALALARSRASNKDVLAWAERLQQVRPSAKSSLAVAEALFELRRLDEAAAAIDGVLASEPDNADAWTCRCSVMLAVGDVDQAITASERALVLGGRSRQAIVNHGIALAQAGRVAEAEASLRELLIQDPGDAAAAHSLMSILLDARRAQESVEVGRQALDRNPEDPDLHWVLSEALMLLGDYARGWAEYEWRWRADHGSRSLLPETEKPFWHGQEDITGKSMLIAPEQGFGDCIQFLRYVPLVSARAERIQVLVPKELHELALLARLPANCVLVASGEAIAPFDFHTSLMSLPLALGPALPIPAALPYLRGDPGRVESWRQRIAAEGCKLNVGVTWSGNLDHRNDRNRSIPLQVFRGIEAAGCRFVSLQPVVRESDRQAMSNWPELLLWGEELRSFLDTASLMEALDVVVAVDTSVVHLAGALGLPTKVLLPRRPDWRWQLEREDTPWYPSARLFRQAKPGDWPEVLARVRADLEALAAQRN
ncbi:tetratricopeptide repeat protein [Ramlibacter sp. Leaf400]|uniref:tetratricopeptide repeat protein n=1 Tax=Ramlibacter sp. Leaf400 TaxID=1736365 RepID=UPI0006FB4EC8|nr:tetratricopeptide repeat protein [Ramlibacter sp. Leaf400]KQT12361.1 hypothetical protein ASG30_03450 [Ramlibacter sp. Leaf400]